jgi:hypothetical protein
MLLPSFLVVDFNKYEDIPDIQLPENTYLSYKITAASISLIDSFYEKLFSSSKKYPFCLLIDLQNGLEKLDEFEITINSLVTFSFHFNYVKMNHDNPLIIFESDKENVNEYIAIARQTFKSQGYNNIESVIIYNSKIPFPVKERKNIRFNSQENINNLFSEYVNSIKQLISAIPLFFFVNETERISEILNTIQQAEAEVLKDLPQTYYLLKENVSLITKKNELLFKIGLLQEQLDSLTNYRLYYSSADTQYKKQVKEMANFYKNEYEILPMWYKRFGHILKVIMGKRTFKSLFNDNVKKYKDG